MNYREDSRPSCATCKRAVDAAELVLDEQGAPHCPDCRLALEHAAIDAGVEARRKRRKLYSLFYPVLLLVLAVIYAYMLRKRHDDLARLAAGRAAVLSIVEPVLALANTGNMKDQCGELRSDHGGAVWLLAIASNGQLAWDTSTRGARLLRAKTADDADKAAYEASHSEYFAVLIDRESRSNYLNGELVVVDRKQNRAVCTVVVVVDPGKNLLVDEDAVRSAVARALPGTLHLVN